jgi:hypothetical protein
MMTYTVVASAQGAMVQIHAAGCKAAERRSASSKPVTVWTVEAINLTAAIAEVLDTCENLSDNLVGVQVHGCAK